MSADRIDIGTVRQWREAGLGTSAFRSLVRTGELKRYRQGVYVRAAYLAAEADGMAKYGDPGRARHEIKRDIRLREAGNKVVHFTWAELFGPETRVPTRIRTAFTALTPY